MAKESVVYLKGDLVSSISEIQYTLISKEITYMPGDFFDSAFSLLREFPKSLLQLKDSWHFFNFCYRWVLRRGINLYTFQDIFFSNSAHEALVLFEDLSKFYNKDLVRVFIIDAKIDHHQRVGEFLKLIPFSYFHITGAPGDEILNNYDQWKRFSNGHELISLIKNDLPAIDAAIQESGGNVLISDFKLFSNQHANELNPFHANAIAETNYFIANQSLANFWFNRPKPPTADRVYFFRNKGMGIQLDQIQKIDGMHLGNHDDSHVSPIAPVNPSLIIVAPYHFPRTEMLYGEYTLDETGKMLVRATHSEQKHNYDFIITPEMFSSLSQVAVSTLLEIEEKHLKNLDHLAYLHALLNNSPVLRLPAVGRSIDVQLSAFIGELSEYVDDKGKNKAVDKIHVLGELMSKLLIHENVKSILEERDGQLVCMTDLPIEWLKLGSYPLSLTHDVCRIPEFNLSSVINIYIKNQRMVFRIKPDIVKKTLIVHCAGKNDDDMQEVFDLIDDCQGSLGFNSVRCVTVEEVSIAVKKFNPDLLIFDCHGDFEEKGLSSFLTLDFDNGVELTGKDIIEHEIFAPLVFISACRTQPNYGYVKLLSDAFFQAGAFSVTATYLPILDYSAASLLIRMLSELKKESGDSAFMNWLAFIAHTLRTSLVIQTIQKVQLDNNLVIDTDNAAVSKMLADLKLFSNREKVILELKKHLLTISSTADILFENFEQDWLFYTTMGRADLVYFEKWVLAHQPEIIK